MSSIKQQLKTTEDCVWVKHWQNWFQLLWAVNEFRMWPTNELTFNASDDPNIDRTLIGIHNGTHLVVVAMQSVWLGRNGEEAAVNAPMHVFTVHLFVFASVVPKWPNVRYKTNRWNVRDGRTWRRTLVYPIAYTSWMVSNRNPDLWWNPIEYCLQMRTVLMRTSCGPMWAVFVSPEIEPILSCGQQNESFGSTTRSVFLRSGLEIELLWVVVRRQIHWSGDKWICNQLIRDFLGKRASALTPFPTTRDPSTLRYPWKIWKALIESS